MQDNHPEVETSESEAQANSNLVVRSSDVLAMIAFEAQKIVAAMNQHAAGAQFPDPQLLGQTISRMAELQQTLVGMQTVQRAKQAQAN